MKWRVGDSYCALKNNPYQRNDLSWTDYKWAQSDQSLITAIQGKNRIGFPILFWLSWINVRLILIVFSRSFYEVRNLKISGGVMRITVFFLAIIVAAHGYNATLFSLKGHKGSLISKSYLFVSNTWWIRPHFQANTKILEAIHARTYQSGSQRQTGEFHR